MRLLAKRALLLVCSLAVAGGVQTFSKAGASEQETSHDHFECQRASILDGPSGQVIMRGMVTQCMRGRGYK